MLESPTARLDRWKQSLLDLSAGSRVLDARESRTTIALPDVDPMRLAFALAAGSGFAFVAASPASAPAGSVHDAARLAAPAASFDSTRLVVPLPAAELARRLTAIRRASRGALVRGGEHVLRLALGLLTWCEPDGAPHVAPLWLLPVELERTAGGSVRLIGAGRPPELNGALCDKLRRDLEIVLDPGPELDIAALFEAAAGIALTRPGWRLDRAAQLGVFSTAAHAMWRDLDGQPRALRDTPVLAHLAGGAAAGLRPLPGAPAVEVVAPLDADASQLAAIAAADAGASFVLDGAAGTGKVQTIANVIAHCVGQGKTLLVVGDHVATLRGIEQRLAGIGLAELCLPLYADDRAAVTAALGRVLDRAFRPGVGASGNDGRLAELRATLDDYAHALHAIGPFGRSVHDALARLIELRSAPRAALADRDAAGLDRATYEHRLRAVEELAATALPVEPVASHAWRASTLERWPTDAEPRARTALDEAGAAAAELTAAIAAAGALVRGLSGTTPDELAALGALAAIAAASPRPGAEWLTQVRSPRGDDLGERIALIRARGGGTIETPRDPAAFVAIATRHRALAAEVAAAFGPGFGAAVDDLDAATAWSQLRRWTGSMAPLRFVALRTARAAVRAAALPGELVDDASAITALEAVLAERACRAALTAAAEPARRWFGALGADPIALDLGAIDAAVRWAGELRRAFDAVTVAGGDLAKQAAWRALVAQVAAPTTATTATADAAGDAGDLAVFARLAAAVARWAPARAELAAATGLPIAALGALGTPARDDQAPERPSARHLDHLSALRDQVETLRHAAGSLGEWVAFHAARHACRAAGVGAAVIAIERGDLGAAELAAAWERATLLEWADAEIAAVPALSEFHGPTHHAHVAAFADLDRGALALARARTLARFAERVPRLRTGRGSGAHPARPLAGEAELAELELLAAERAHPTRCSIRALLAALPAVLPRLAPCLLMTPAAVAAHLDPALRAFDVVVVAGAAQLPIAHALGALARGAAVIAVGDARHAQPDSVIAAARAASLPELRLAWHHRSRHPDLIALANQRDYAGQLQVFPTALASAELGVSWRTVAGTYDRTGAQHNRVEATAVVADVLARLRDPAQAARSLAVIALGRAQHELLEDLLDAARAADPALDRRFEPGEPGTEGSEPVIVAHVDDMTAEDRDVVLVSVGYDAAAPELWRASRDRPLATAIARAREQLVVFSSMAPEDLAAEPAADLAPAVADLRALLAFARAGGGAARPSEDAEPATAVTAAIARALGERGWTLRHRVGVGPFTIDLAVVDPNDPERFVLAIEHDGPAYATAAAARDRDRLRGQVLGQLGWRMHRIWALDWWADTAGEIQRAHGAIVAAIAATRRRAPAAAAVATGAPRARPRATADTRIAAGSAPIARGAGSGPAQAIAVTAALHAAERPSALGIPAPLPGDGTEPMPRDRDPRSELSAPLHLPRGAIAIGPYTTATIPAGRRVPDDLFAPRHAAELGKIVEQVLAAEAPMHLALLARRVGAYFGIGRVTQRVTEQIRTALAGRGRWGAEDGIVWRLDQDPASVPPVRVAGSGPEARRDIDEVPLSELAAAARIVVERATALTTTELARDAARLLGFARITDRVIDRIGQGMELAATRELIEVTDGKATLPR